MDYCFLGTEEAGSEMATSLIIRDSVSSYCGASLVRTKGPVPGAVAFLAAYLDELGYPRVQLQTDGEPAIVALAKAVIKEKSKDAKDIKTRIAMTAWPRQP